MKRPKFGGLDLAALVLAVSAAFYAYVFAGLNSSPVLDARFRATDDLYSQRYAQKTKHPSQAPVVIAAIDEESLTKLGERWPWSRKRFAEFILRTAPLARVVAFDLSFAVPSDRAEDDDALADAISKNGCVVLSYYKTTDGADVRPLPILTEKALGAGYLNQPRDSDNKNRRDSMFLKGPRGLERSFALSAASYYLGRDAVPPPQGEPVDPWLAYDYAPADVAVVPFWKFLKGGVPASLVKDRIVIVGATAEILHDSYDTPIGVMPGVMLHANRAINYVNGVRLREWPAKYFYACLLGAAILAALAFYRLRLVFSALLFAALLFVSREAALRLFMKGVVIDAFSVYAVLWGAFAIGLGFRAAALLLENRLLRRQSWRDGLTDLYTYKHLERRLKDAFDYAKKSGESLSFVIFDLDHFKRLNDAYGHEKGNEILIAFARILKSCTRGDDLVARYGGEEFCLLLPHKNAEEALQVAERVRASLESTVFRFSRKGEAADSEIRATVSAGICSTESGEVFNGKELLRLADAALLNAKTDGRNRCIVHRSQTP